MAYVNLVLYNTRLQVLSLVHERPIELNEVGAQRFDLTIQLR